MTSVIRLTFGFLSCLLLSAGMARAAQTFDRIAGQRTEIVKTSPVMPTMPCIVPNDKR
jgi:hypothetical protein